MHGCGVTWLVHTVLTLPRLEVQFPPEPHMFKKYTLIAPRLESVFLKTQELRMNADVFSAYPSFCNSRDCLPEDSQQFRKIQLSRKTNKQKDKLDSARLFQPTPYGFAIKKPVHPSFRLIWDIYIYIYSSWQLLLRHFNKDSNNGLNNEHCHH